MINQSPALNLLQSLSVDSFWLVAKVIFLIAFGVYFAFTIIAANQTYQMRKTFQSGTESLLLVINLIHVSLAVMAFLWALMVL